MCNRKYKPLACGYHSHAEFSLDSGTTSENKLKYAAEIGRVADTLTDHGIVSGLAPQWFAGESLKKKGVLKEDFRIIQGVEAYVIDEKRPKAPVRKGSNKTVHRYYHLTIHFLTMNAYFQYSSLTKKAEERAIVKYGETKPLIFLNELEPFANELTLGSACLGGPVQKNVLQGKPEWGIEYYEQLRSMVQPGNFYVEVFPHVIDYEWQKPVYEKQTKKLITPGFFEKITAPRFWDGDPEEMPEIDPCTGALDIQKKPNQFVLELAKKYGDKPLISLDDHYGKLEDRLVQEARLGNGTENWRFYNNYHMMTSEEAATELKKQLDVSDKEIEEWIDNGYEFVEKFDKYKFPTAKDQVLLPTTEMIYEVESIQEKSNVEIFWEKVAEHGKMPAKNDPKYQIYLDRINFELKVMTQNKAGLDFLPYFFLLEDACNYARKNNILYTSRGSAGGSLVLYVLDIIVTNPIERGLSFERFLNVGRIDGGSLPDVDLDWENRIVIIEYLKEKYGDKFGYIANDTKMKLKSSLRDSIRSINGSVKPEEEKMVSKIKIPLGVDDEKEWLFGTDDEPGVWESGEPEIEALKDYAQENPKIWEMTLKCIGITRQRGVHAGGVVITPGAVENYIPVIKTKEGEICTAYNMHGVEETGGIKYDILGIKTLDALGIAIRGLKKDKGIDVEWGPFPEEREVYENIIKSEKLEGVFQLNTNVARPFVKKTQPKNIQEIAVLTALCRPGALDAPAPDPSFDGTAAEYFVECAQGLKQPFYIHEDLKEILSESYGVIVYQEQAIKIGTLVGYSESEADLIIRKGIGKKIASKINKFSEDLRKALPARGWTDSQIELLIETVKASAKYSFNKSHSESYALVAWNCAWMKYHYPAYYWKGMLMVFGENRDKLHGFLKECGGEVLGVDVRFSDATEWVVEEDKYLRPPLSILNGCGERGVQELQLLIQDYQKHLGRNLMWPDFLEALKNRNKGERQYKIQAKSIALLIYAGAFDDMMTEKPSENQLIATYYEMFSQALKAMNSRAKLPTANKTVTIALDSVQDTVKLGLWRHMVNPLAKFDFLSYFRESLFMRGFRESPIEHKKLGLDKYFPMVYYGEDKKKKHGYLVSRYEYILDNPPGPKTKDAFIKGFRIAALACVITDVKVITMPDGRQRTSFEIYTGYETVDGLTLWPDRKYQKYPDWSKALKKESVGVIFLKFNEARNGRVYPNVIGWHGYVATD